MASEIKVDTIVNAGGDNDTGIDLATNDQILLKVANATKLTMNSTGQTTIVGEGGTTTTNLQQGLCKAWINVDNQSSFDTLDSFNVSSVADTGVGIITPSWANGFNTANYVGTGTCGDLTSGNSSAKPQIGTYNTGSYRYDNAHSSHVDGDFNSMLAHGDLA